MCILVYIHNIVSFNQNIFESSSTENEFLKQHYVTFEILLSGSPYSWETVLSSTTVVKSVMSQKQKPAVIQIQKNISIILVVPIEKGS